jgi:hypothetical protein
MVRKSRLRRFMRQRSTIAFLMCLPLIVIICGLVIYPALYSIQLSMLNKAQTRFIGLSNFTFLMSRDTFWMVVWQSTIFALSAVFFKALIGLVTAHLVNNLPVKGQRKWRGMLSGAVGDPAGPVDARLVVAVRSHQFGLQLHAAKSGLRTGRVAKRPLLGPFHGHLGECLVRRAVLPDYVSGGAQIGARATL